MSGVLLRADERAKGYFGGPGISVLALVVVAAIAIPVSVSALELSTFSAAAGLYVLAIVAVIVATALRSGPARAGKVATAGIVAVAILFAVGWSGIFSMSADLRWSGLSAVTGVVLGSSSLGAILRRSR